MSPALVFDVGSLTGLRTANDKPSGIQRVQLEVAAELARTVDDITFSAFDRDSGVYFRLSVEDVLELERRLRGHQTREGDTAGVAVSEPRSAHADFANVLQRIARVTPGGANSLRRSGYYLRRAAGEGRHALREARRAFAAARTDLARGHPPVCFSAEWSSETVYCSMGADWVDNDLCYLSNRRAVVGFRALLTVYDLTPVVTPQYKLPLPDLVPYFDQLLRAADGLLVISQRTIRDLRAFGEHRLLRLPPTYLVPLGSGLLDGPRRRCSTVRAEEQGEYVLVVGTVEIRKNHHLLLDVWEMMLRDRGAERTPVLVIAGQRGWLSGETISRITRTPRFADIVRFVEGPSDAELAWLYEHALFTVYPALYEGWGLPVTESLDFGKLCLTSDTSSLPEAGKGLTDLLDPFDRAAWQSRIEQYWENRSLVAEREGEIAASYRRVTSAETARDVLNGVATLAAVTPEGT